MSALNCRIQQNPRNRVCNCPLHIDICPSKKESDRSLMMQGYNRAFDNDTMRRMREDRVQNISDMHTFM